MNKTIAGILVGIVVVVGGAFIFLQMRKADDSAVNPAIRETGNSAPLETLNPNATNGKKIPFSEFIKQNGSYKCTVNQDVNNTDIVGTTYINNGMIRGEYNIKAGGMNVNSTMIVRDGYTYSWSSVMPGSGYKAKIVTPPSGTTSAGASGSYGFNANNIGDYSCEAWTLDTSKFTLPTNITFTDVSAK